MADRLPTPVQLAQILHRMWVDMRIFAREGRTDEIHDVADLAELIPLQFINRNERYLEIISAGLYELAAKYPDANYTTVLDLTDEEIHDRLCPPNGLDWTTQVPPPELEPAST
jgi:hypothetical protein